MAVRARQRSEENLGKQEVVDYVKHCRDGQEDVPFGFCTVGATDDFSTGSFGLVVRRIQTETGR